MAKLLWRSYWQPNKVQKPNFQSIILQTNNDWLPVTSPHGNFATVTSPQKLRHMVTLPHFEKVKGDVGIVGKCVGVWGEMSEEV